MRLTIKFAFDSNFRIINKPNRGHNMGKYTYVDVFSFTIGMLAALCVLLVTFGCEFPTTGSEDQPEISKPSILKVELLPFTNPVYSQYDPATLTNWTATYRITEASFRNVQHLLISIWNDEGLTIDIVVEMVSYSHDVTINGTGLPYNITILGSQNFSNGVILRMWGTITAPPGETRKIWQNTLLVNSGLPPAKQNTMKLTVFKNAT